MQKSSAVRLQVELGLAVISAVLSVLTFAWPAWIEDIFGVDPDAGSGASEWAITVAFIVATLALAASARRTWRRSRAGFSG